MARLRHALSARLGPTRTRRRLGAFAVRSLGLAYANLIRFRGPVSRRLLERVKTLRRRDFGTFTVDAVEVLRTDKVLSEDATQLIAHVPLGGRG
jgi:hypothetical protein